MSRQKNLLKAVVMAFSGIACFGVALIVGLQENVFFAAISFLSFFMLGVILLHGVKLVITKGKEEKAE